MQTFLWNPWSIFDELDRMNIGGGSSEWPAFDIEDNEDATTLTADLPGITEDELEISVTPQMLTVRGERKARPGNYVRRARWHGAFERRFRLADGYDVDALTATFENGVLSIRLAKAARMKPRRIKLGSGVVGKVKSLLSGEKAA